MKKIILTLILTIGLAFGFEVGAYVGLNNQSWKDNASEPNKASGISAHGGILGSIGITPSCLPVYVGLESGFILQKADYKGKDLLFKGNDLEIHMNNLIIPVLLKANLKPSPKIRIGAGLGPSFIIHNSGSYEYDIIIHLEGDFDKDNLEPDVGFMLKGDMGIQLMPLLWLKPTVAIQLNNKPDDPRNKNESFGEEMSVFFSVGLVLSP